MVGAHHSFIVIFSVFVRLMLLTHKPNCRRWMSYSIERTSRVRIPPMTSRYRIILHLVLDSGLILTVAKILELVFFLLSTEPDVTGRTNETFRIVNEMLAMIAVSHFPLSIHHTNLLPSILLIPRELELIEILGSTGHCSHRHRYHCERYVCVCCQPRPTGA